MRFWTTIALGFALCLAGCVYNFPDPNQDNLFACTDDSECNRGAVCIDGRCRSQGGDWMPGGDTKGGDTAEPPGDRDSSLCTTDLDGDLHGAGCAAGPDDDDTMPQCWTACSSCVDGDGDDYWVGCDDYTVDPVLGEDCNDSNANINPQAQEACDFVDNNCNGTNNETYLDTDSDTLANCIDPDDDDDGCDDAIDPNPLYAGADTDLDQVGEDCDCDDNDGNNFPGNPEACDGQDNDCDVDIDEGYPDTDSDGTADCVETDTDADGCPDPYDPEPSVFSADGDEDGAGLDCDCDDDDPLRYPYNLEVCDGLDNDCDALIDEDFTDTDSDGEMDCVDLDDDDDGCDDADDPEPLLANADADLDLVSADCDCDDGNDGIFPGAIEECDGLDNNCDGAIDEGFPDSDGDGTADCVETDSDGDGCPDPIDSAPLVFNNTDADHDGAPVDCDCADNDPLNYFLNVEVCDGQDNNCKDGADEGFPDTDSDGSRDCVDPDDDDDGCLDVDDSAPLVASADGDGDDVAADCDCDDNDIRNFPGNTETCDGQDNNCAAGIDEGFTDTNADGEADCIDPDDDGDGCLDGDDPTPLAASADVDGDHHGDECDCDDSNPDMFPGNPEVCDGLDNDCNAATDEGFPDTDNDGIADCVEADADADGCLDDDDPAPLAASADIDGDLQGDDCDCDDSDPDNFLHNVEVCDGQDNNCDMAIDEGFTDTDSDGEADCVDPDDDGDGCLDGDDPAPLVTSVDGDGDFFGDDCDCDDSNPNMFPDNPEVCDGLDNNCDAATDEGFTDTNADGEADCVDPDDDGDGCLDGDDPAPLMTSIDIDDDLIGDDCDCDDSDPANFPYNPEVCDGQDNNCDTLTDEGFTDTNTDGEADCVDPDDDGDGCPDGDDPAPLAPSADGDGDLHGTDCDCDDGDTATFTGAAEVCDGNDNSCAGSVPLNEVDSDGDLHVGCAGWSDTQGDNPSIVAGGDCDENDPASYTGASEVCDGNDNACAGFVPADEIDNDGDRHVECAGWSDTQGDDPTILTGIDCDDAEPNSYTGAPELCDRKDNACTGSVPANEIDDDADGQTECEGDCDDTDIATYTGAAEICDGNDNDCTGPVPLNEIDNDGDFRVECAGWSDTQGDNPSIVAGSDCDDADPTSYTGAIEVCDGNDNACAGAVPLDEVDNDGDLHVECAGWIDTQGDDPTIIAAVDCDDDDPASYTGAAEACDGNDNACAGAVPLDEIDNDGDLYVECADWSDTQGDDPTILTGVDCDDGNPDRFPGNLEVCNGVDNDCDGSPDNGDPLDTCGGLPPDTVTIACNAGVCETVTCSGTNVDVNGTFSDGCECVGDAIPMATCASVLVPSGVLNSDGATWTLDFNLPAGERWFRFDFPLVSRCNTTDVPTITLATNPGNAYRMSFITTSCAGGSCTGATSWTFGDVAAPTCATSNNTTWPTTVYVRVYRVGAASCADLKINVSR